MNKKYTIYISYKNTDNFSPTNQEGWVTGLQHFLEKMLWELFEFKVNFLPYSDYTRTSDENNKTNLFVCILSPDYVQSQICIEEVEQIYNEVFNSELTKSHLTQRILKILKHPVAPQDQPAVIRHLTSYNLFHAEPADNCIQEIIHFSKPYLTKEIWLKLADLAYDIHESLKDIQFEVPLTKQQPGNTVFLAETETELFLERHIIKRELEKYGYKVLPEQKLPADYTELEVAIRKDLDVCKLSIHLIADSYNELIDNSPSTIAGLQHKIATDYCKTYYTHLDTNIIDPAFSRLIWVSPRAKQLNISQLNSLLDARNKDLQASTEVFQTSLKSFKSAIWEELKEAVKYHPAYDRHKSIATWEYHPEVYLLYDKTDSGSVRFLLPQLQKQKIKLIEPYFSEDAIYNRKVYLDQLIKGDIIILFKGNMSEQWLRMKALDIMKAPGYGRKKSPLHKAIIIEQHIILDRYFFENLGFAFISDPQLYIAELLIQFKAPHRHE